jgi:hypothetical protein
VEHSKRGKIEVFKIVIDGIDLSEDDRKELSSAMEKATTQVLAKRAPDLDVIRPPKFYRPMPEIRGRIVVPAGLKEKELEAATFEFRE